MENLLDKLFNNEIVNSIREFFSLLTEKIENISFLNRNPSKKFLMVGFGAVIGLLLIVSAVFMIAENKKEEDELTTDITTAVNETVTQSQTTQEIDSTFLLALTDNDSSLVHSIIIAKFNSEEESLTLNFVDPNTSVTVNESTGNINEHLKNGGISQFLWAISEHTGVGFNRYLIGDEAAFVKLVEMLGERTVEIENSISYSHDGISFIIDKGTQNLTADMMLKYYLYLISNPQMNAEKIAFVLTDCLSALVTSETDDIMEDRFCTALGFFTTDISAIDFSTHKDAIRRIPQMALFENTVIE